MQRQIQGRVIQDDSFYASILWIDLSLLCLKIYLLFFPEFSLLFLSYPYIITYLSVTV